MVFWCFPVNNLFTIVPFFLFGLSHARRDRVEWRLRDPQERAKRNERRADAPFPSAVAVSRNILCGRDDTDKDIWANARSAFESLGQETRRELVSLVLSIRRDLKTLRWP